MCTLAPASPLPHARWEWGTTLVWAVWQLWERWSCRQCKIGNKEQAGSKKSLLPFCPFLSLPVNLYRWSTSSCPAWLSNGQLGQTLWEASSPARYSLEGALEALLAGSVHHLEAWLCGRYLQWAVIHLLDPVFHAAWHGKLSMLVRRPTALIFIKTAVWKGHQSELKILASRLL